MRNVGVTDIKVLLANLRVILIDLCHPSRVTVVIMLLLAPVAIRYGVIAHRPYDQAAGMARQNASLRRSLKQLTQDDDALVVDIANLNTVTGANAAARRQGWVDKGEVKLELPQH